MPSLVAVGNCGSGDVMTSLSLDFAGPHDQRVM